MAAAIVQPAIVASLRAMLPDAIPPTPRPCAAGVVAIAADQFNGIDAIHRDGIAVIGMKVRRVMLHTGFHEHSDDDSEKSA